MAAEPPADDPRFADEPTLKVVPWNGKGKPVPTAADPMAGLAILPSIVMRGKANILAEAAKPIEYVWQEIAVAGTVNLIAGPPAEGKTTLLFLLLACRMAPSPMPFLGRMVIPSPAGKFVVLIEAEHSDGGTARKLIQSFETMNVSTDGLEKVLVIARKSVKIGDAAWSEIAYLVSLGLVSDIAIDTLARSSSADSNNEEAQAEIFETIAMTIERGATALEHPTVWLVAHTRKNDKTGGLGDVSGSTQRTGQSDTVIMVNGTKLESGETTKSTVTFPKLREPPDVYPKPATFSVIRDPDGRRRLTSDAVTAAELAGRPLEDLIWDQLTEPRTKSWLAEKLGRNRSDVQSAVDNLFASNQVCKGMVAYSGSNKSYPGIQRRENSSVGPGRQPGPAFQPDVTRTYWDGVADSEEL